MFNSIILTVVLHLMFVIIVIVFYLLRSYIGILIIIIISAAMVLHLANTSNRIEPWKLLVILDINTTHVIVRALSWSGFNVGSYEIMRDLALLLPDLLHVLVAYFELSIMSQDKGISLRRLFYNEEIMISVLLVTLFVIFGNLTRVR